MNINKKVIGIIVLLILEMNVAMADTASTTTWQDTSRNFRLPVTVNAAGFDRIDKPVELDVNFTQLLNSIGKSGTLDENSIHVVETDSFGTTILNFAVLFQFDKDYGYDPTTKASGTITFVMDGITQANKNRYYYIYFNLTGGSYSPFVFAPLVTITDNVTDEGQSSFKIDTLIGTYNFQKDAGGFSSLNDISGNDWINYNRASGTGIYRGIPNAVYAQGIFHPGFTCCTSNIVSQGPLKIKIRSVNGTKWESIWEIYPKYAKMAMTKANNSYWFLYEGTPGGVFEPNTDFVVRSFGSQTLLNQSWYNDIPTNEWVYFGDPNVGRSLFAAHHEDDTLQDMYKPCCAPSFPTNDITVFGFGRSEWDPVTLKPAALISSVPQHFTIGLLDGTNFTQNSKAINSAYKDLIVNKGVVEQYNNNYDNITVISETRLTSNSYKDRQPAWSPDGQWIVWASKINDIIDWDLYKMRNTGDGSGITRLTTYTVFDLEPSWGVNNKIVFASGPAQGYEDIFTIDADGTNRTQLTNPVQDPDFDEYPDWSPDGTKIVYSSVGGIVNGTKQLWIMNANGTNKHKISSYDGIQAAWSPDGSKIAFKSYHSGSANIWMIDSNGNNPRQLTFDSTNTHDPDWSPDGRHIVYASNRDGDWEIYVMNADGTNKQQLTSNIGIEDNYPRWSPDGQHIVFSSNRTGNEEIWDMKVSYNTVSSVLSITSYSPTNNPTTTIGTSQSFNINLNKTADINWYVDGNIVKTDTGVITSSYTNSTAGVGTHNVNAVATDGSTTVSKGWTWTVNSLYSQIILTSPNGGEVWTAGSTHDIIWTRTSNIKPGLKIELYKGGVFVSQITYESSRTSDSYSWTIPSTLATGTDYKVKVTGCVGSTTCDSPLQIVTDMSDNNFAISAPTTTPSVIITSPNGGEVWTAGSIHSITWTRTSNVKPGLKIELYKGGVFVSQITYESSSDSYSWTIPSTLATGTDYKVKVTGCVGSTTCDSPLQIVTDMSDNNFTIGAPTTTPSVIITSPNGGENWIRGTTYDITWTRTSNVKPGLKIELYKGGVFSTQIVYESSRISDSYGWTIPSTLATGTDYKVKVIGCVGSTTCDSPLQIVTDMSDNNFAIS